jgi:hypothetical protein
MQGFAFVISCLVEKGPLPRAPQTDKVSPMGDGTLKILTDYVDPMPFLLSP